MIFMNRSKDALPGEHLLFTIRGSRKKRFITAAIFSFFLLLSLAGAFVFKSISISILGIGALDLSFWPLTDAYGRIEVTNLRIKYSDFSKKTAKTEDIPLDSLASCSEVMNESKIELLFLIDNSKTVSSIRRLQFSKTDENAVLLTQLPCPRQGDLKQILESDYR